MNDSPHRIAIKIALTYVSLGGLWIIFTDYFSFLFSQNGIEDFLMFQRYKGWIFTLMTGILLYFLVEQRTKQLFLSTNALKEKENQLEKSTLRYESLFQHNPDAVIELDLEGKLLSLNQAGKKMLYVKEENIEGIPFMDLVDKKDKDRFFQLFKQVLKGKAKTFELVLQKIENQRRTVRCTLLPIIVDHNVTGVYGIAKDITEQKRNEELMIKNEKMYVMGQLAASVAHEIRNPLTSIKGFVQLMNETNTLNQTYLELMMSEIDRMNTITSEMLYLGKNEEVTFEKVDLQKLLHVIALFMDAEANMNNTTIKLHQLPKPVYISGDPNQLKQVFINIIKNSIEAIEASLDKRNGSIHIYLLEEKEEVIVSIKDNGGGIEQERIKRLGELFYSTKEKGTGLGLAVCTKIVKRHKGTIEFDSQKERGTTVSVKLPKLIS
ncbi:ATP-binding protein [Bacillus sp. FJAT-47783]|uniref:ATP-binding protein n=1 Tax=Bacillus sp. FJAT-47783 TaxID=2922712 RepID=UPI001FAD9D01|nr:ATP-binding protein [Bacillus sp. FJAT-47783]